MAKMRKNPQTVDDEGLTLTQLATRIPKDLHKVVKVWCVTHDTSVADFVTDALRNELEHREGEPERVVKTKKATKPGKAKKALRHLDEDPDYPGDEDDEDAA